jgi:hypothetical protein
MKHTWMDIAIPLFLLCIALAGVAYSTYFSPKGQWFIAVFPQKESDALAAAAPYANAVAASYTHINGVLVYAPDEAKRKSLKNKASLLIEPQGTALCRRP